MKFQDKVVVVTGGGSGIGQQVVIQALARGARVAAVDLRQEGLDQTVEMAAAGARLATYTVDVTDRPAVEGLPGEVESELGSADVLIHCAGIIQPFVRLNDLEYATMEKVVDVNFWGTVHVVKAFLPGLVQRPEGHVALVSSMGGFLPVPGQTIYGATKAAVKLLGEGLYAELVETAVGVSVVMPGAVGTNITTNSGVDVPGAGSEDSTYKVTSAEDAGRIILDGIEEDEFHIYVGRDARTMNIFSRIAPKRATNLISKQMKDLLAH